MLASALIAGFLCAAVGTALALHAAAEQRTRRRRRLVLERTQVTECLTNAVELGTTVIDLRDRPAPPLRPVRLPSLAPR